MPKGPEDSEDSRKLGAIRLIVVICQSGARGRISQSCILSQYAFALISAVPCRAVTAG